ncbi:MAG: flagellar basal-body rod protein FlgG [Proteobacteria bacterium SG_bin7]|nr:MAG: flagellar basal-body rod protein FlgG [Proteobacteria bacterium SG_bin7]
MLRSLNTAATGMNAQQQNMDVIANNMANINTQGFKKSRAEFEDLMYQTIKEPGSATGANSFSPTGVQTGLGVKTAAVKKDFAVGTPKMTNNALDMQIEGNGFFPVETDNGQIAYTRDGAFKKDSQGRIVDKNGFVLQPEMTIPPNASGVEVTSKGQVNITLDQNTTPQTIGQIQLVNFVNPAGLKAIGKNLFLPSNSSGLPQQAMPGENALGTIAQGQLENSNVNIVDEMVNMIAAQRAYETNSKVVQAADQMLQNINGLR